MRAGTVRLGAAPVLQQQKAAGKAQAEEAPRRKAQAATSQGRMSGNGNRRGASAMAPIARSAVANTATGVELGGVAGRTEAVVGCSTGTGAAGFTKTKKVATGAASISASAPTPTR